MGRFSLYQGNGFRGHILLSHIQHSSELSSQASHSITTRSYRTSIMDTRRNGSHLSRQQLAIGIQNDRSFSSLLPLLQASSTPYPSILRLTFSRPSIRSCISMVSADSTTEREPTKIRDVFRAVPNSHMWWMDIHNIYGRSRLARHFYDLVYCCNPSMDSRLFSIESQ